MGRKKQTGTGKSRAGNGANLRFEEKFWAAVEKMRGHMDAAEHKHVTLGLIFLEYFSDAFQERYDAIRQEPHADPEDRDEYTGEIVFWELRVPTGTSSRVRLTRRRSARSSTGPWARSRRRIRRSSACCPTTSSSRLWITKEFASGSTAWPARMPSRAARMVSIF
jgi:hypothetical protein